MFCLSLRVRSGYVHLLKGKSLTHSKVMKKTGEKGTQDPEARKRKEGS